MIGSGSWGLPERQNREPKPAASPTNITLSHVLQYKCCIKVKQNTKTSHSFLIFDYSRAPRALKKLRNLKTRKSAGIFGIYIFPDRLEVLCQFIIFVKALSFWYRILYYSMSLSLFLFGFSTLSSDF